jgi:hypothetical protein
MNGALVKLSPPGGIAELFADPPLVGNESREEYDRLFAAIATAAKPADAIAWLFVRDIADLSWEIRRERSFKLLIIKFHQETVIRGLLTPKPPSGPVSDLLNQVDPRVARTADKAAREWANEPEARPKIEKKLAGMGYTTSSIFEMALMEAADRIDAIDRRLASYEQRRLAALKATAHYSETLARRLETASSDVIEGEFTEAAE